MQPRMDVVQHDIGSDHETHASKLLDEKGSQSFDSDAESPRLPLEDSPGDGEDIILADAAHDEDFSSSSDEFSLLQSARTHGSRVDSPGGFPLGVRLLEVARLASTLCQSEMPPSMSWRRNCEDAITVTRVEARSIHQHNRHVDCSPYKTGRHRFSTVHRLRQIFQNVQVLLGLLQSPQEIIEHARRKHTRSSYSRCTISRIPILVGARTSSFTSAIGV